MAYPNYGMMYPQNYQNGSNSWNSMPQQSYTPPMNQIPQQNADMGTLKWVDGEVGAKAYQLPAGLPPNTPVALWDTNDCIIYLKSVNQVGMPNPLQKVHYTMEETQSRQNLMSGQTSSAMTDYVTKEDLNRLKDELLSSMNGRSHQSSGNDNSSRNGGGNR